MGNNIITFYDIIGSRAIYESFKDDADMDNKDNIIELSCYQKQPSNSFNKANKYDNDYEDWEDDYELISKEDYAGLVKYRSGI